MSPAGLAAYTARMTRVVTLLWLFGVLLTPALAEVGGGPPAIRLVEFEASVNPITARRITRAIDEAERAGDSLVLVRLDTPGGLVASMEQIVKRMLASRVPVVVWVGPAGAKAASAGFFILLAADVAAMAPGTTAGAAATIHLGGENRADDVALKKMNEVTAALLRSIAERRGRDVAASERAVFEAKAYEESKAKQLGLIDLVVADRHALLAALDGMTVRRFDGSEVVLATEGAGFVTTEFSWRHELMEFLTLPIVAYALLMLGLLGLYVEFTQPGLIFPGAVGALCLLLFALSTQGLPVSAIGILLILLAIVLFVLEVKIASYGLLTIGGIVSLTLGSLMLIDGPIPALRLPPAVVLPVSLTVAGLCVWALRLALRAQRLRVATGVEGLAAEVGTVRAPLAPEGKVFIHGELWDAVTADGPLPAGSRVRVVAVDSMRLVVAPAEGGEKGGT